MSGLDNTSYTVRTTSATTDTLTNNDAVVIYTAATLKTCNLPAVASIQPGREFVVINTAAGAINVDPFGSELINGSATPLSVTASTGRARFISDGTQWWTISSS